MKAGIVLPTYNEKQNLEILFPKLLDITKNIEGWEVHLVVVDDNSPDGTSDFIQPFVDSNPRVHLQKRAGKMGLGSAYIHGFRYAIDQLGADAVFSMDSDLSHPPELIPTFLKHIVDNDIVIGSRYIPGGDFKNWPAYRKLISRGANIFGQVVLGLKAKDISSGYRCYSADLWKRIGLDSIKTNGYCTLEEILYLAKKKNAKVHEIPLIFVDRQHGETKLTTKEMVRFFTTILKLRFR